ncbi:MAG: hypothetical protein ACE5K3_03575 [bacterium]
MFNLKLLKAALVMVAVLIFVISYATTTAYAPGKGREQKETPPGWEKGDKESWKGEVPSDQETRPPGWKQGEKKGWFSDVPLGLAKKEGWVPPGWSKGEKEGWMKSFPPGWEKRRKKEQSSWINNLNAAKDSIKRKGKRVGFSQEEIEQASTSLELASRIGVPIEHAKDIVQSAMDKGLRGLAIEKVTRAVSYGVGREVKFDQLGKFVNEKLTEGLKGEELALEIYIEIQRRQEEKTKVRKAIQEEKKKKKQDE